MNQVKATAATAWSLLNVKAPRGLQITKYLSRDKTARDQAVTSPEVMEENRKLQVNRKSEENRELQVNRKSEENTGTLT